jgi:UDP-N-acetylmuramyl tripeptide synthase
LLTEKSRVLHERLGWQPPIGWFALDYDSSSLRARRESGAPTCGVRHGRLVLDTATGTEHDLGAITDMPLTVAAAATYNISNLAGAALAAAALGIEPRTIAWVFASFGSDLADNAGRLMQFQVGGVRVVLDYAHNPDGLRGVLQVARQLRSDTGRLGMLLGHAGNRLNKDIEELAYVAAEFSPELIVVKEDEGHLRGRQQGEVPAIILNALLRSGLPESAVPICPSEVDAASLALDWARPGDAVVLLIHASDARVKVLEMLRSRSTN